MLEKVRYKFNENYTGSDSPNDGIANSEIIDFHKHIPGYDPSPLIKVESNSLTKTMHIKDESTRFNINSFKGLGASYSIFSILKERLKKEMNIDLKASNLWDGSIKNLPSITFSAATDGNHGKAVAWFSKLIKQTAIIYMPENSAEARIKSIEAEGATVVLIDGTFDDCVRICNEDSTHNNYEIVSDTAYIGNLERPMSIILGYTTLFKELDVQTSQVYDYVFVPAGVGGIAAAAALYFKHYKKSNTKIIVVEPLSSSCILESLIANKAVASNGLQDSIMAGLNCGFPSLRSWDILKNSMYLSIAIPDMYVYTAATYYYRYGISTGESGAAALAGLLAIMDDPILSSNLNINSSSVLLLNTEGMTNPEFCFSLEANLE
ncbi:diaminopropionate ammonia-lyase [Paenibacillus wenxiniae]|uniref:Diaminopropionate ammonia-lyase n=1 Tax=Paenibacillus wenxiniae TaxID=1636843 RepID=A0ABW4RNC7_9BACL